jgi:hypothetical protein
VNGELKRTWKEVVVAYFRVLLPFPGGTKENHKKLSQDNLSVGRDLNPRPPK